ncbi:hypothetical protein GCM10017673_53210 [Streptosporangium violaceochromogenes]|nr:hypothetical protein GCM10017673_53210 [Streptosporangium violaceochromogenes]
MVAALGAAVVVGVGAGLVARLLMRVFSLLVGVESSGFSAAGTAGIAAVFVVLAVPAAATAVASPALRRAGRWITVAVAGWTSARTGLSDAKTVLLADEERLPLLAAVPVAFAVLVVTLGWLTQWLARRLAGVEGEPATPGNPASPQAAAS